MVRDAGLAAVGAAGIGGEVKEAWQAFDGVEVSTMGRVRRDGRTYSLTKLTTGYLQVKVGGRKRSVHRLVCHAFHGAPPVDAVTNHKNGIKDDNRPENLEWVSRSQNGTHAYRVLGRENPLRGRFSASHPTSRPVVATEIVSGQEHRYASAMDAVREGFRSDSISRCCNGKIAHHKGRFWRFA